MNGWVPFVGLLSLPIMLIGFICLLRPIARIKIPTRQRAGIVFGFGIAGFIAAFNTTYTYVPRPSLAYSLPISNSKPSNEPSYEYLRRADGHAKLIALKGPNWSKADLTYVLSACWRFSSGGNIVVGRATCALAFEELALPTSGIDHDTENPMGSCYIAAERAMFRMELIDKEIEGDTSAMDAILAYDAKVPSERNNINEEFASCQKALPELRRDMKLILELDYPIKAAGLVAGRRKREGMEALETAGSLVWPEENLEEKAQSLSDQTSFRAKRKAEAERAIRELQR